MKRIVWAAMALALWEFVAWVTRTDFTKRVPMSASLT